MIETELATFEKVDNSKLDSLTKLSNFEVSALFLKYAANNLYGNEVINAGRGNPNWINTRARLALNRIVEFGVADSKRSFTRDNGNMAGFMELDGIESRFDEFMDENDAVDSFLLKTVDYAKKELGVNGDEMVKEMADGAIGNNYPVPSRSLVNVEKVLSKYLQENLYNGVDLESTTDVFPTEGGTAAMVYIFNELKLSHILNPGDTVAINTPIFTPYLQIPELKEYNLKVVPLLSNEDENWQMSDEQLDQLKDHKIKAFFDVNPTNPAARAFSEHSLEKLQEVVKENPELVIVTDDVYGTFAEGFKTIYAAVPQNTLLVYSFSKLFGATGQRLGLIAANKDNVFDKIIAKRTAADPELAAEFEDRYSKVVTNPLEMKFIDRTVADSRAIGLYHTAGLSTPQQVMMELFSMNNLVYANDDSYLEASRELVNERYHAFWDEIGIDMDNSKGNTKYYTLIDIYALVAKTYGKEFGDYFKNNYQYLDFPYRLATEFGVVVMDASGFGARKGYVRLSLANLTSDKYTAIAKDMKALMEEYYAEYQK